MTTKKITEFKEFMVSYEPAFHWISRIVGLILIPVIGWIWSGVQTINAKLDKFDTYIEVHSAERAGIDKSNDKEHDQIIRRVYNLENGLHPATANRFTEAQARQMHEGTRDWVDKYFIRKR